MEKDTTSFRLAALDGLRGFAIILVFLNHINTSFISGSLPAPFFSWIFLDGVTGVTFLFILSGFLMAYLYSNPPQAMPFLQKRYTRIFPLFLTMCAVMLVYRLSPHAQWFLLLGAILVFAFFTHLVWVYGIKKLSAVYSRGLFVSFLLLQVSVGVFYVLWIMRQPAIVFNQILPPFVREGMIGLVNATLTPAFGDYVPMLDGVYWSLAAEVLFYVLYAFILTPIINLLTLRQRVIKIAFLLCLIPLLGGINMISYKIFVLSLFQPALFYYFATGIFLGYIYKKYKANFVYFSNLFKGRFYFLPLILFLIAVITVHNLYFPDRQSAAWIRLGYALPLTFCVAMMLDKRTIISKIFSARILVFLGTVSYSIYLSHAIIIHIAEELYKPTGVISNIAYVVIVFSADILIASFLFLLLEKPYFRRSKQQRTENISLGKKTRNVRSILYGVCIVYIFSIFFAYQSSFNFFSVTYPISSQSLIYPGTGINEGLISMKQYPKIQILMKAKDNNLGLITVRVNHTAAQTETKNPQLLLFSIKEKDAKSWYGISSYKAYQFDNNPVFPFGFPRIAQSKGKTYLVELALGDRSSADYFSIDSHSFESVYEANKIQLIKDPLKLLSFIEAKLQTVLSNKEALLGFILVIPFLLMVIFLSKTRGRN